MVAKVYKIAFTQKAIEDVHDKKRYISYHLQSPFVAQKWALRLGNEIRQNLQTMPLKFPAYKTRNNGLVVRKMVHRNDVILYSVEEKKQTVYIHRIFTGQQDIQKESGD